MAPPADDQSERARELEEWALAQKRERVRNPDSDEAKRTLALHKDITEKLQTLYAKPQQGGEEDMGDESFEIDEPPSHTQEPTEETMLLWNDLTKQNRIFPADITNYEREVDAILSRNIGKKQLEAWLTSAFNEAKYSYYEWTTQVNDLPGLSEKHEKREQVMKMVQRKIQAKLDKLAMEF